MRSRVHRLARSLLVLLLVATLPGCSTWKPIRTSPAAAIADADEAPDVLVLLEDGSRIRMALVEADADSLRGWLTAPDPSGFTQSPRVGRGERVAIAVADVKRIETRQHTAPLTVGLVTITVAAALFVTGWVIDAGDDH